MQIKKNEVKVLGISAYYHDSAAALVIDGNIISAAQEERFTRKKHTAAFPVNAIRFCLEDSGLELSDVDAVVFYDKPFLKFERLLETYFAFAPKGLLSFLKAIPLWIKEKLFLKDTLIKELKTFEGFNKKKLKILFSEHHLSHAASAFYPSPFEEAAILTIDGVGEWCTTSMGFGKGNDITFLKEMHFPHSVGLLYSAFTYYLGFSVNSGEYKLMGLAPYGNPGSTEVEKYIATITSSLLKINSDGSIWLDQKYFNYAVGLTMTRDKLWEMLFGFKRRTDKDEILQHHCDLALAIQLITEDIVIRMAKHLKQLTNADNLCMAGGVALNCVANGKLKSLNIFKNIYIQPAAGDSGCALGAALAVSYSYFNIPRLKKDSFDEMRGTYLGPDFSEKQVELMCKKAKAIYKKENDPSALTHAIAALIAEGNIIGWFQGKMEFGPRALGNRSILADARSSDMQKKLNLKIKNREGFRPFAPAVLKECAVDYFEMDSASPYMLFTSPVLKQKRNMLPSNYDSFEMWDKLHYCRSEVPAITHIDFSARIQTVDERMNPLFYQLIKAYQKITGTGLVINTSFNVRGEPIVCSPEDAYRCFMCTDMDYLVINNFILAKTNQPDHTNKAKWFTKFDKD